MGHFSCEQKIVLVKIDAISQRPYFVVTKINKPKRSLVRGNLDSFANRLVANLTRNVGC